MANLNRVELIGFVGGEPTIRVIQTTGRKVASFSVATTEKGYTAQNGTTYPDRTEWHSVTIWGKLADVVEKYVHKGSSVYVSGKLRNRQYEKNGVTQRVAEVECEEMQMLDRKPQGDGATTQQGSTIYPNQMDNQPQQPQPTPQPAYQNDLPF